MNIPSLIAAAFLAASVGSIAVAEEVALDGETMYYTHNESFMKLTWDELIGEFFEIRYEEPKSGLNVPKGTLLIDGSLGANGEVSATAFVFKNGCDPAPYAVSGKFDGKGNLTLKGDSPVRTDESGCNVVGYTPDSKNADLYFQIVSH